MAEQDDSDIILIYRDISMSKEDYRSLQNDGLLTNGLIDFYLEYIYWELFSEEMRSKIHICKSDFYSNYAVSSNFSGWRSDTSKSLDKRYSRVSNFHANQAVNLFEKDFIVVPCNIREHWLLAIVCYPKLNGAIRIEDDKRVSLKEAMRDMKHPTVGNQVKQSCILVFDSLKKSFGSAMVTMHLRNFFKSEYKSRYEGLFEFESSSLIGCGSIKVPVQNNSTDCGLFLLEFFEHFFIKSPIFDFRLPMDLRAWFDPEIILSKREAIENLLLSLMVANTPIEELSEPSTLKLEEESMNDNNNNDFDAVDKSKTEDQLTELLSEPSTVKLEEKSINNNNNDNFNTVDKDKTEEQLTELLSAEELFKQ